MPLRWTTEKPDRLGWYWYRDADNAASLHPVWWKEEDDALVIVGEDGNLIYVTSSKGEWAGPLEPPLEQEP